MADGSRQTEFRFFFETVFAYCVLRKIHASFIDSVLDESVFEVQLANRPDSPLSGGAVESRLSHGSDGQVKVGAGGEEKIEESALVNTQE